MACPDVFSACLDLETFCLDRKRPSQVRDVLIGQFPFKYSLFLRPVMKWCPGAEPQQAGKCFQTRRLQKRTRWEVCPTSRRETWQDSYQVGRAKVRVKSWGGGGGGVSEISNIYQIYLRKYWKSLYSISPYDQH